MNDPTNQPSRPSQTPGQPSADQARSNQTPLNQRPLNQRPLNQEVSGGDVSSGLETSPTGLAATGLAATVRAAQDAAATPAHRRDPELVARIRSAVAEVEVTIAGSDQAGETYWDKVGRLNAARMQATEIVLAEQLPTPVDLSDCPEPPLTPADPAHPLNRDDLVEQMTSQEYRTLVRGWMASDEYQIPAEQAAAYRAQLRTS